jgi:hypothetical protein
MIKEIITDTASFILVDEVEKIITDGGIIIVYDDNDDIIGSVGYLEERWHIFLINFTDDYKDLYLLCKDYSQYKFKFITSEV